MRNTLGGLVLVVTVAGAPLLGRVGGAQEKGPAAPVAPAGKAPDIARWPLQKQQAYLSARGAADWLRRANRPDGRFVYGFLPALCVPLDGDDYLAQAGAAFALARAARYFGDEGCTAVARQSLLTLLLETAADPKDPHVRQTAAPPQLLSRLAGHGLLLLAIHEPAAPGKDLLDQGEQLANYLRRQQRPDGVLLVAEAGDDAKAVATEAHLAAAGLALHGVARSHKHRPAPWQMEMVRKARGPYLAQWQAARNVPQVLTHTPAYAEAYLATREPAFADAVYAMNDWLCGLQYVQPDPQHKGWLGGFPPWQRGQAVLAAPDVQSAACAESLAEACRVARAAGDAARFRRYGQALERCLHFLAGLQYTAPRTRHFVEDFRPAVLGAFHASHQDGTLRLDYTQHPLSALVLYLEHVAE